MNLSGLLDELLVGARLLYRLPTHLRRPVSPDEARAILRRRLTERRADFLVLAREAIYSNAGSPYRQLLRHAGCEYGDLEALVSRDGVEGALRALYRQGVYLTVDELKGRRPAVRGSTTVVVDPLRLRNPRAGAHVLTQSGGSRGTSALLSVDLASVRDRAVNNCLTLEARAGGRWRKAIWGVPGRSVSSIIRFSSFCAPLERCFLLVDSAAPGLHPRYRWSLRSLQLGGVLGGVPLPAPEHVPVTDPLPVAHWMADVLRAGQTPHLFTFVSSAVRLCQAAAEAGVDLRGVKFTITGEPITPARLAVIREAGAEASPDYGSAECGGTISYGCLAPAVADEVHLFEDLHALIEPGPHASRGDLPPGALLVSSLRSTAPLILFNVSMGDRAEVVQRACGCPFEELGWTTHLHTIRSFEKLTAGGMTFLDADVIWVLEEVLPARFGGGPTEYQLVEDESSDGQPRLRLLVHPAIGPVDPELVVDAFLAAIGGGSGAKRVMELQWRQARFVGVEREAPRPTTSGKILHLHQGRRAREGDRGDARPP